MISEQPEKLLLDFQEALQILQCYALLAASDFFHGRNDFHGLTHVSTEPMDAMDFANFPAKVVQFCEGLFQR